jgi:quercetin dioxygenase-like cupin family protein
MSMAYLAQPAQQQQLEWLDGGTLSILLDAKATGGQLMVGRFDVREGEAPPYHKHTREDEVFMLIKGTALVWVDDQETELSEGGIVFLPRNIPHGYRITSKTADLLMINTPAGIEGMFRFSGRDKATPRPEGFEISPAQMAEGAARFGQVILGPPR